jgi:integrase
MSRPQNKLTALQVARAKSPALLADGGGLYLQVEGPSSRAWLYRYAMNKKERWMGLGSLGPVGSDPIVSLAEARQKAADARALKAKGIDPIDAAARAKADAAADKAKQVTFEDAAARYIAGHKAAWRNAKHGAQWTSTLKAYAYPVFGALPVQDVDTGMVLKALEPIWTKKTETATRVRQRIEAILDWAKARGHRMGENPARWRGHLENLLPKPRKVQKVEHHPALPYSEIGAFVAKLRDQKGVAARALEVLILTTARTGEVTAARWAEMNLDAKVWTVPADRIKAGREHRVPLSEPALGLLKELAKNGDRGEYVFEGWRKNRPLSNGAFLALLKRMKRQDLTAHGFRSTFRDWAAECTNFPREVAEMALAHAIGDKVEAAYRRGDLFEKRRKLMEAWAGFCSAPRAGGDILTLDRSRRRAR